MPIRPFNFLSSKKRPYDDLPFLIAKHKPHIHSHNHTYNVLFYADKIIEYKLRASSGVNLDFDFIASFIFSNSN
jgi:hypothetical protein